MDFEIAIIDNNSLARLGLESLLEEIIPGVTIRTFGSFAELVDDTPDMFYPDLSGAHHFLPAEEIPDGGALQC